MLTSFYTEPQKCSEVGSDAAGGHLLALDPATGPRSGRGAASPAAFAVAHRYEVADGATWTVPVPLPDGVLVWDATGLTRLAPSD
ncbi:MAG: hypothetical protein OXH04_24370 [Acidobacteria bacterium]|nr:hypothetical protein [Acidobacteriota bacterium]